MFILTFQNIGKIEVDFDNPENWSIDPKDYINRNPLIVRKHFPIIRSGRAQISFGLLILSGHFTTREALEAISGGYKRPNLAETNTLFRLEPELYKTRPIASFCGLEHYQGCERFISYVQANSSGLHLFNNWMGFRRDDGALLVVVPA